MRTRITLACTECKQRNYNTTKDKKTHPDRMDQRSIVDSARLILCTKKLNNLSFLFERKLGLWQMRQTQRNLRKQVSFVA